MHDWPKHTRTCVCACARARARVCVCVQKTSLGANLGLVICSKLVYRSVLGFKHVYPVEQMNRIITSTLHVVCIKIFMLHIWRIFNENTHRRERNIVEIDERENNQSIFIAN